MRYIQICNMAVYIFGLSLGLGVTTGAIAAHKDKPSLETAHITLCRWHITHRFAQYSVAEAYHRLGIKTEFSELPCRRSLIEANAGGFDGEMARIYGVTKVFENLVQLESPTIMIEGIAFKQGGDLAIETWQDLKGRSIGIIRGELYAEKGTAGLNPTVVDTYDQLFSLIVLGRLEIGVAIKRDFEILANSPKFMDQGLRMVGEPLFSAPLFHLVHKRNKQLVEDLNKIFKAMWENGDAQLIHKNTMQRMLSGK